MENGQNNPPVSTPPPPPAAEKFVMDTSQPNENIQDVEFDFSKQDENLVEAQFNPEFDPAKAQELQQNQENQNNPEGQQEVPTNASYGSIFKQIAEQNNIPLQEGADFDNMNQQEFNELMNHVNSVNAQSNLHPDVAKLNEYVQNGGNINDYYTYQQQYQNLDKLSSRDTLKIYELDPLINNGSLSEDVAQRMLNSMDKNELELKAAQIKTNVKQGQNQMLDQMNYQQQQQLAQQHQQFMPQLNETLNIIGQELDGMDDYYGVPMDQVRKDDFKGHLKEMFTPQNPMTPTPYDQFMHALQSNDPHANQMKVDVLFAYHLLRSGQINSLLNQTKESVKEQMASKLALKPQLNHQQGQPQVNQGQTEEDVNRQFKDRYLR